jgi:ubiquinone biosynthesis protein UbiJ
MLVSERSPFLALPIARPINHMLRSASWARERLRLFCEKTVRFNCAPFVVTLTIGQDGEMTDSDVETAVDVEFTLTVALALRALADHTAWQEIKIAGDNALGSAVAYIAQHLRWDMEEDLSRVVGDIAAHRIAQVSGEILRGPGQIVKRLGRAVATSVAEKQSRAVSSAEVDHLKREVETLHEDVERLARRVQALQSNL